MSLNKIGIILVVLIAIPYSYGWQSPQFNDPETISRIEEMLLTQQIQISELTKTVSEQNVKLVIQTAQINELKENDFNQKGEILSLKQRIGSLERQTGYLSSGVAQVLHELQGKEIVFNGSAQYASQETDLTLENTDLTLGNKSQNAIRCKSKEDQDKNMKNTKRIVTKRNTNTMVGFYAYMSTNEQIGQHKVMVFNVVETNIGKAYNNHTGLFVAPVTGLYAFSCSLSPANLSKGSFHFMLNDRVVSSIFADSDGSNWDITASSMTVVLLLQQGDDFYLRSSESSLHTNQGMILGVDVSRSSLSGWLISE